VVFKDAAIPAVRRIGRAADLSRKLERSYAKADRGYGIFEALMPVKRHGGLATAFEASGVVELIRRTPNMYKGVRPLD
jgi:hypothetical protein